jgi:hypothetical protein
MYSERKSAAVLHDESQSVWTVRGSLIKRDKSPRHINFFGGLISRSADDDGSTVLGVFDGRDGDVETGAIVSVRGDID